MRSLKKYPVIFSAGAVLYCLLELIWRKKTHWSMGIAGGLCLVIIYKMNERLRYKSLLLKCGISCAIITSVEFIFGCIFNIWLKMNVWSYSSKAFNIMGQICPLYCFLWYLLSIPVLLCCEKIQRRQGSLK